MEDRNAPNPHYMTQRAKSPGMVRSKLQRYHGRKDKNKSTDRRANLRSK